ncbi:MAG: type I-E CRISPR-associated protein Cse2/CasB [Candidatus Neomarinimicrobiota bacterium]
MSMDFKALVDRLDKLGTGPRAELRRCATPQDVALVPAFYRLFVGIKTDLRHQRIAFFLPLVRHKEGGIRMGQQLAKAKINEQRMFQVLRSQPPNDLIQLRRLVQQAEPQVDWQKFGEMLYYWGPEQKQRLLEDYFMHQQPKDKEQ